MVALQSDKATLLENGDRLSRAEFDVLRMMC